LNKYKGLIFRITRFVIFIEVIVIFILSLKQYSLVPKFIFKWCNGLKF